jgi:type II secretory ATPase GspE/PulE/Tfp pilus assembly ATPase PilB-like protein
MKTINIDKITVDISLALKLPHAVMVEYRIIPLYEKNETIYIGVQNRDNDIASLSIYYHKPIKTINITIKDYDKYIQIIEQNRALEYIISQVKFDISNQVSRSNPSGSNIMMLLESIIESALLKNSSDIHIEALQNRYHIRFRVDGDLELSYELNIDIAKALISKIKILSSLDISKKSPQDGGFSHVFEKSNYDFRVATVSTNFGESMVIRILYNNHIDIDINTLGFSLSHVKEIIKILDSRSGLVLVTGSTGSGKSTSLYAFLNHLKNSNNKIITVEDPIEYQIEGVSQIQVDSVNKSGYSEVLKNILRLDPDYLMIGEIRDTDSLEIAMRSALTGHLVLSTLHTNDAIDTLARLKDMGVATYLLASTLSLIISQRLIKKLCNSCKTAYTPPPMIMDTISDMLPQNYTFYQPNGCSECSWSGYNGRVVVAEVLVFSEEIKELFKNSLSKYEILNFLSSKGHKTIMVDAIKKSANGHIYLNDIL